MRLESRQRILTRFLRSSRTSSDEGSSSDEKSKNREKTRVNGSRFIALQCLISFALSWAIESDNAKKIGTRVVAVPPKLGFVYHALNNSGWCGDVPVDVDSFFYEPLQLLCTTMAFVFTYQFGTASIHVFFDGGLLLIGRWKHSKYLGWCCKPCFNLLKPSKSAFMSELNGRVLENYGADKIR
jgi:hypothetical protein